MTFQAIQQAVYRRVKLPDSPSAADSTRIKQFINLWYRRLLAMPGMDRFRDTTLTFASVANQKKYGLPQAISRVRDIYDLTNQRRVLPRTMDYLRNVDPGLTATSSFVENWIPLNGWGAELVELTSTGVGLWVVSDNAADTTIKVFVETIRLGGVRAGTAVSGGTLVTGTARAAIGSLTDHIEVVKFYVDVAPAGTLSLMDAAAAGNTLSQITPGRTQARYFMLQLYPTPGAAVTYSVDCQRAIEDLVQATEEPLIHEDYHHALVHLATADEWQNRNDDRWKDERADGMNIVSDMRHAVTTTPDELAVQRGPRGTPQRVSRLGGYFPSST